MTGMSEKVLVVDDEPRVLDGIRRGLHGKLDIVTASGGREGLDILAEDENIAVVMSDMQMPNMSGAEFLAHVRQQFPNVVRLMLTGNNDQETAKRAVNEGAVFRFLNKPCTREGLVSALDDALSQSRLLKAEKDVLERTLGASVTVLADILAIAQPQNFGSVGKVVELSTQLANKLGGVERWTMHAAATLSTLGYLVIPDNLIEKRRNGVELSTEEQAEYRKHAKAGAEMIRKIPRMDEVADIVRYQERAYKDRANGSGTENGIPLGASILHVAHSFILMRNGGWSNSASVQKLRAQKGQFDPDVIDALEALHGTGDGNAIVKRVPVSDLNDDMTIAEDIRTVEGVLIVCKGQPITSAVQRHLQKLDDLDSLEANPLVEINDSNE